MDDEAHRSERIASAARKVLDTPDNPAPAPFSKIDTGEGIRLALDGDGHVIAVMEDVAPQIRRFALRRANKFTFGGTARAVEWAYVELADGLRIYMSAAGVVVTRADVNP